MCSDYGKPQSSDDDGDFFGVINDEDDIARSLGSPTVLRPFLMRLP